MKVSYVIPVLLFALGIGLLIFGTSGSEEVTLLGLTFHPRIAKGAGIIVMIFSVITLLVAYGSSLPPKQAGRRK
jgi:hypothetical protein